MVNEKKKLQKAALGLQDSDDEDLEHDIDEQIESMLAPKRIVKEISAPLGTINPTSTQSRHDYYIINFVYGKMFYLNTNF